MALLVYVDDIVITGSSLDVINKLKESLSTQFRLKDLGTLKHFLGLEIARSPGGIVVSQRQYVLDLLQDAGMLASKPVSHPMDPRHKMSSFDGELLSDPSQYRRLIGRLLYFNHYTPIYYLCCASVKSIHFCTKSSTLAGCSTFVTIFKRKSWSRIISFIKIIFTT